MSVTEFYRYSNQKLWWNRGCQQLNYDINMFLYWKGWFREPSCRTIRHSCSIKVLFFFFLETWKESGRHALKMCVYCKQPTIFHNRKGKAIQKKVFRKFLAFQKTGANQWIQTLKFIMKRGGTALDHVPSHSPAHLIGLFNTFFL